MQSVSYVTTVYNKSEFIRPVVEAMFAQNGDFEKEYIFIDDGSTDNSLDILQQMTAGRDDCTVISEANAGPSRATNKGLSRAGCEFIKMVDGDDILPPDMTRRLLSSAKNNDCPVVIGEKGSYIMTKGGAGNFIDPPKANPHVLVRPLEKLLKNAFFTPTHMLFRRDLLDNDHGCDERVYIQDYSIALRLARVAPFAIEPDVVFYAPAQAENRMSKNVGQTLHDLNAALYYFFNDYPDLDSNLVSYGIKRATGRAWRWARREGVPVKMKTEALVDYLASRLPGSGGNNIDIIRKSCRIFQSTVPIKDPLQ